jgi:hypothetical protein
LNGIRDALPLRLRLEMLGSVLEFMRRAGTSESAIRESFERSLNGLAAKASGRNSRRTDELGIGNENISAELLRIWHRDSRYIDSDAKPRPLFLTRGRHNLSATIARLDPTADAARILSDMRAVKLIRKTSNGRYLPTSEAAIVGRLHPLATDHIAKLVIRLVSTVSRNVDPAAESLPLIERHAYAPDLNFSEREAFAEFTRLQGMAYLESVDSWLEQRRVRRIDSGVRRNAKGIAASVHLFAYLGDGDTGSTLSAQTPTLRLPKRSASRKPIAPRAKRPTPARVAHA